MEEIIGKLTAEHAKLSQVGTELLAIRSEQLAVSAAEALRLLHLFSATLANHIALEDKSLYPETLKLAGLAPLAVRFLSRRKQLEAEYDRFKHRWSTARAIQADARTFRGEMKLTLATLAQRMFEEDEEFHPAIVKAFAERR